MLSWILRDVHDFWFPITHQSVAKMPSLDATQNSEDVSGVRFPLHLCL